MMCILHCGESRVFISEQMTQNINKMKNAQSIRHLLKKLW